MNGQLYQPCDRSGCRIEPVCSMCEYCEAHCTCPSQEEKTAVNERRTKIRTLKMGFSLIEKYIKKFGDPCQEIADDAIQIHDSRTYHTGIGYGPGTVIRQDLAGSIYLTTHTGSKVVEWASHCIILKDDPDEENSKFGNDNAAIIAAIRQLAAGKSLNRKQQKALV